jgi:hypothetical protein
MLDEMDAARQASHVELLVTTEILLKVVPIGLDEGEAKARLNAVGFSQAGEGYSHSEFDKTGPQSEYYMDLVTQRGLPLVGWNVYVAKIGVTRGHVDFVYASVRVESL